MNTNVRNLMIIVTKKGKASKENLPRMKKLAGSDLSDKLLYVKSRTSSDGNAPNPRGKVFSRFILSSKEHEKKYI